MGVMSSDQSAPLWSWRLATVGFGVLLAAVAALVVALALGAADTPRAGPLLWMDDFKTATTRWEFWVDGGSRLAPREGALVADLAPGQSAAALTARPAGDFTMEIAGAQTSGDIGARYGLVFNWRDAAHYSAVLINGNGYAEAYQLDGRQRQDWFAWQEWPNILVGTDSNRVRLDVRGRQVSIRINDEILVETGADSAGSVGVMTTESLSPSQVVFSWVKVWGKSK
jgi:hypothetical protein